MQVCTKHSHTTVVIHEDHNCPMCTLIKKELNQREESQAVYQQLLGRFQKLEEKTEKLEMDKERAKTNEEEIEEQQSQETLARRETKTEANLKIYQPPKNEKIQNQRIAVLESKAELLTQQVSTLRDKVKQLSS